MTGILAVIVNYKTARLCLNCVRSLIPERAALPELRVVVVENDSGDAEALRAGLDAPEYAGWVELVVAAKNGGFSYGNNQAVRGALRDDAAPELVMLLNPDAEVRPGALRILRDFMRAHPKAGIAGAGLLLEDGREWNIAFKFPTVLGELDRGLRFGPVTRLLREHRVPQEMHNVTAQVDWVPGAAMMVRREVFETAGLMDEGYFLYYEETDFCLAARRAGWECWYVPEARVMHISGAATGVTVKDRRPNRLPAYWFESRNRYFIKNHGKTYATAADVAYLAGLSLFRVRNLLQQKGDLDPPHLLQDFLRNSILWPRNRKNY
jgi:N-acetylglucosaminyl-diphospho-decaprenol L-rhamnosyltransferase